jgi:beta-lactamase regulating signal transducer with metallopeptidase domain
METLFVFLIKASAGIILFYMVYWLFLRQETFYNANRWFLIVALISAILLPILPLQYTVLMEQESSTTVFQVVSNTFNNIPSISESDTVEKSINWQQAVLLIYLTGVAIFLFRLLVQSFILIHLMIKYRIKSLDGVRIVENEKYGMPFSFFNIVFINPKNYTQGELPEILAHEKVHIRENHWFDLILIELLTVIFWFNPFIWFFERSIKQNHEYLADKGVVSEGHNVSRYQAILVNQLMGMQVIGITNNLNFALNTNRLKMMTKKKTSRLLGIKFVWTLPVLALLLFAFAEPIYRVKEPVITDNDISIREAIGQKTVKMHGIVLDENDKPLPGTAVVIKGTAIGTVCDLDGSFKLEVPENAIIVLSFVGKKTIKDSFLQISSAKKVDGVFYKKYKMEDAVIVIHNRAFIGEQPPPPPPPKPVSEREVKNVPPPPPPLQTGGDEIFYVVEDMPKYPGGFPALEEYYTKMQYKLVQAKGIKGQAKVAFTVNGKGKVTDIKVVEKDNDGAAKGAVLIANGMKDWTPGKQRGKAVPVKYLLPVKFK